MNDLAISRLLDDENGVAAPDLHRHRTLVLGVQCDGAGCRVRGTARDSFSSSPSDVGIATTQSACCDLLFDVTGTGRRQTLEHALFGDRRETAVDVERLVVAGIEKTGHLLRQNATNDNFVARVRQEHARPRDELHVAGVAVEDVTSLARRNGDRVVLLAVAVLDDGVLGTRIVDGLVLAGDEELFTDVVFLATLPLVLVLGDDLDVEPGVRVELDGAELLLVLHLDESLRRRRKDDGGTLHEPLLTRLVEQDAVLEALERECIAHVLARSLRHHLDAGRRHVERDLRTTDDDELTHRERERGNGNDLGLGNLVGRLTIDTRSGGRLLRLRLHHRASPVLLGLVVVVDTDQKVLVGAEVVAFDDLGDLPGPQSEARRPRDVHPPATIEVDCGRPRTLGRVGLLGVGCRVGEHDVVPLGSTREGLDGGVEITHTLEALGGLVPQHGRITRRNRRLVGANVDVDLTLAGV